MSHNIPACADIAWIEATRHILKCGREISPRMQLTYEVPQYTVVVDTRRPVLTIPERRLSYKFMAAEALWILSGDDRVATIAPFNKNIAQFSDDGEVFAGAYGPRIKEQIDYVVLKLVEDADTRQAGLTIWRPSPTPSKDIPCTVAIWFQIRGGKLNVHVFMRSSDVWLGLPYDVFNFSMLCHQVCYRLRGQYPELTPGTLFLTAASMHLYECNREDLESVFDACGIVVSSQPRTPFHLFDEEGLHLHLHAISHGYVKGWWV